LRAHRRAQETGKASALDPELDRIVKTWPTLPANLKGAILRLIEEAGG
jgi:hypothetical protein